MTNIRVRTAPSPTGFAHVGTGYVTLLNYAFAKKNGGKLVLRLEDTDQKRHVPEAEAAIYSGLEWLGLSWDEGPDIGGDFGPYRASERLGTYKTYIQKLLDAGKAYDDEGAIRFKNTGQDMEWNDAVRGHVKFPGGEVTDFVIQKSDGFPTYNFAVVVDDIEMKITHVIRGEEHISNTPRQLALYQAFGAIPPEFAHFSTLRNAEHKKLSKRRDPVDLRLYREAGYLPEAIVNFLCLFGWSHPDEKDKFNLGEFVEKFTLERLRKAGPVFDTKKLDWLNGQYIRELSDESFLSTAKKYISADVDEGLLRKVLPLVKERISKFSEIELLIKFLWESPAVGVDLFDEEDKSLLHLSTAISVLTSVKDWGLENINNALQSGIKDKEFKVGEFYMTLRYALAGKKITPPINEMMEIMGQDFVLQRLSAAEKILEQTS